MKWLHRYAMLVAAATWLLVIAGAMVTSTQSGLAVPDWPTSYGHFMFSFPLSQMIGGIFYEHGHRMIASIVGLLTIGLAIWIAFVDPRPWMRRLGAIAVLAVVLQGMLGGLTVLYFLPAPVSIGHAGLAQVFFALTISLAVFTSVKWVNGYSDGRVVADLTLSRLALAMAVFVYFQILVGATMRHTGAGLAIPDFPWMFGSWLPPRFTPAVAVHFAHRVGALLVTGLVVVTATWVFRRHRFRLELVRPAATLVGLVTIQLWLGALTIWSGKAVIPNTAHVAVGALVLATSLVLALRANRSRFSAVGFAKGRAWMDVPNKTKMEPLINP